VSLTSIRSSSRVVAASGPRIARTTRGWRYFIAPAVCILLGLYALMHSPARSFIAGLVRADSRGCYFCIGTYPWSQIATPVTGVLLIGVCLMAAWFIVDRVDAPSADLYPGLGVGPLAVLPVAGCGLGVLAKPRVDIGDERAVGEVAHRPQHERADEHRGGAPRIASELRTLAGCLWHIVRRRCANGVVLVAQSAGRLREALAPEALGELSGSFAATAPGTYRIDLKTPRGAGEKSFPPLAYTVAPTVTAELPRPPPNYGLLEHLADATGGRLNPAPKELAITRPLSEQTRSLNPWLILIAMILLITEALVRRLAF